MAATNSGQLFHMPFVLSFPPKHGRKPMSIPDTTQFSGVTQALFGVPCATPEEPLYVGTHNELYLLRLSVPESHVTAVPTRVLARVSRDDKTRSDISLESEIATMVFVKSRTKIPVPTVYGYCATRDNAIGQPFSILSFTEGVDMNGPAWENLPPQVKLNTIRDYAHVVLELYRLRFDRIGSIYFKRGASPPHCYELGEVAWWKHESAARRTRCDHYDRGPWKSSGEWVRAALTDEIQSMNRLPEVIRHAYNGSFEGDDSPKWRLAQRTLPEMLKRVEDVIEDGLDRFCAGPFVLCHMDLTPRNIIVATEGVHAGRIVGVVDWEMAMTAPIWALVCYPTWFDSSGSLNQPRNTQEAQLFKDTYVREIQKNMESNESDILIVIQNARAERRRRFADVALLPWPRVDAMLAWMDHNPPRD